MEAIGRVHGFRRSSFRVELVRAWQILDLESRFKGPRGPT